MESSRYSHGGGWVYRGAYRLIVVVLTPEQCTPGRETRGSRVLFAYRVAKARVKERKKERKKLLRRINEAAEEEERKRRGEGGARMLEGDGREKEGCRNLIWTNSCSPLITGGGLVKLSLERRSNVRLLSREPRRFLLENARFGAVTPE